MNDIQGSPELPLSLCSFSPIAGTAAAAAASRGSSVWRKTLTRSSWPFLKSRASWWTRRTSLLARPPSGTAT